MAANGGKADMARSWFGLGLLAALVLIAGCAQEAAEPQGPTPRMADACQLRKCVCVSTKFLFFSALDRKPPEWRTNGEAYCPDDHSLTFAD
jgi:hypothetical protein